jgi:four helix bundle protein
MFGLTSQIRRSSVSIAANIVEGYKKKGKLDKLRFFNIAQGSLEETRYYLILAKDLKYHDTKELLNSIEEISKMLNSYCNKIISSNIK